MRQVHQTVILVLGLLLIAPVVRAQPFTTTLEGRVLDAESEEPLAGATVVLEGTDFGAATDEKGRFIIRNIPGGRYMARVSYVGYTTATAELDLSEIDLINGRPEYVIRIGPEALSAGNLVVTATRTERERKEVPIIVNVLGREVLESTQSASLAEGLSYQPGLRLEVDCQTCNYTQVRLNGLGGSYSQVLINSRPIFSALNGLYGLEQIPAAMIERVEVVRGGGSALFGASAVAGTLNIITREPVENSGSVTASQSFIGGATPDRMLSTSASLVNRGLTAGAFVFGMVRSRQPYDNNGDAFSEIPLTRNASAGVRTFYKPSEKGSLTFDAHHLTEERHGGNRIGSKPHEADQGEYRLHHVTGGGLTYEHQFPSRLNHIAAHVSGQYTFRDHYTGIDHIDAYGTTNNLTMVGGVQYSHTFPGFLRTSMNTVTTGVEVKHDDVHDEIPAYERYLDQQVTETGLYAQSDWKLNPRWTLLIGGRTDFHSLLDAPVFSPRLNVLHNLTKDLQLRGTYATGFRAPQAFDADLHIAFAGGGISLIRVADDLTMERSRSLSGSVDFNRGSLDEMYGFTLEGFYTRLMDTFILEQAGEDADGNLILERRNGGNSTVAGLTAEIRYVHGTQFEVQTGLTLQQSGYDEPVRWSAELPASRRYLRAPDVYGFYFLKVAPAEPFTIALTGVLTGPMQVPHLAGYIEEDRLVRSPTFLETNLKLAYTLTQHGLPGVQVYGGIQNGFNAYQSDFDHGKYRDSNYVYGPARPRTFFLGLQTAL